ncbi:MAG: hypothetical protein ACO1QS_05205 [Verrucomicrobiota bacterium]
MRNTRIIVSALATFCVAALTATTLFDLQAADKPKFSMEEIMKTGMKGDTSTLKKVVDGLATDAEKKQLVEYCKALTQHEPAKGDAESWKKKTAALLAAAEKVAGGDKAAIALLKETSNCKACHSVHKGEKK